MHVRMVERYVEDMRPPEDIGSGDYAVVELFVLEDGHQIAPAHIEEERVFVPFAPVCPTE